MFTRLKESFIENHGKEYSDSDAVNRMCFPELHLVRLACTSVTAAECVVIMKRFPRFFFGLELVTSILNIDIKVSEKELEPVSES